MSRISSAPLTSGPSQRDCGVCAGLVPFRVRLLAVALLAAFSTAALCGQRPGRVITIEERGLLLSPGGWIDREQLVAWLTCVNGLRPRGVPDACQALATWGRDELGAVVAAATIGATAQQRLPRFQSGTTAVVLDVTVLDQNQRPVRGLSAADFTVLDDGEPQAIASFTAVDVGDGKVSASDSPGATARAAWLEDVPADISVNHVPPDGRVIVLVLDDLLPMGPGEGPRAQALASSVIDRLAPSDLVAVVFASGQGAAQNCTTDRGKLRAAVARYVPRISREFDSLDPKSQLHPQWALVAKTFENIVAWLGNLGPRRKAILWVTSGPTMGEGWSGVLSAAHRANVTLYPLNPGGLSAELDLHLDPALWTMAGSSRGVVRETGVPNRKILRTLAEATGGFMVAGSNDPAPQLARVFAESGTYYLIGFEPAHPSNVAKWHSLQVRVNRPGLEARTRRGYVSGFREKVAATRASSVAAALRSPIPSDDVALRAGASAFRSAAGMPVVGVVLGVDQSAPARSAITPDAVDIVVSAYDAAGKPAGSVATHFKVGLPAGTRDVQYEALTPVTLNSGRYGLRIVASSTFTGKTGSVNCEVDVPDFAREPLSLSGVVLSADPDGFVAPRDALRTFLPVVPTSRRSFFRGEKASTFLRAYQGGKEPPAPVTLAVSITDSRGAIVFETSELMSASAFTASRSSDHCLDLPLDRLSPGRHLLTFLATAGKHTFRRQVRFEVE
jgi:VWFA-related protein